MSIDTTNYKQPLGLYDIFGYILPGFFFFSLFIVEFDGTKVIRHFFENGTTCGIADSNSYNLKYFLDFIYFDSSTTMGLITFLLFLVFCYLLGHIVASFSSFLSKQFVKRYLKYPSENLFPDYSKLDNTSKSYKALGRIYTRMKKISKGFTSINYKKAFDEKFRIKFKNKIDEIFQYEVNRNDYYWLTYSYICSKRPDLVKRIQHFVNLAGFARNVTGAFLLYIILRFTLLWTFLNCGLDKASWIVLGTFTAVMGIMFWTYLRLHKRQAVDMFYMFLSIESIKKD